MTDKIKTYALIIVSALLLLSIGGNVLQGKIRKNDRIAADLARANSNTLIAAKTSEVEQKQAAIESIRKERTSDSLATVKEIGALKGQISAYRQKLKTLPKTIVYNPDSATVDSLRVAFTLKDSVIDTQALMIIHLESEKEGIFASFNKEIKELQEQRAAQVVATNELQTQLVAEQGKVRKEVRKRKFWRTLTVLATGGIAVLLLSPK